MQFSIKRREKIQMNFIGSPQCGNAGDMKFDVTVEGFGYSLDADGFVFDSVALFDMFKVLKKGRWSGSCEGLGIYAANWLMERESNVGHVTVTIVTESGNQLTINLDQRDRHHMKFFAIKQQADN